MSPRNFRYIVLQNGIGAALFNVLINGAIGWVLVRERHDLPTWGAESVVTDTLIMSFLLAFMTYLIVGRQTRKDLPRGKVEQLTLSTHHLQLIARLPRLDLQRALGLGLISLALFAVPVMAWFSAAGIAQLDARSFIVFKGCLAGVQAAVFTPLTVIVALAGAPAPAPST